MTKKTVRGKKFRTKKPITKRKLGQPDSETGFLVGFSSVFDIFGASAHRFEPEVHVNAIEALRADFEAIGGDFEKARERLVEELHVVTDHE